MRAEVEFVILPYDSVKGRSVLDLLIDELRHGGWTHFRAAVAFARISGNFPALLDAIRDFARNGQVRMTFGANTFVDGQGSDIEAIRGVLQALDGVANAAIHLYHEATRTFHPKLYLFSNDNAALAIVGSSNWTEGGLYSNVEANVFVRLDLSDSEHRQELDRLVWHFETFWEQQP